MTTHRIPGLTGNCRDQDKRTVGHSPLGQPWNVRYSVMGGRGQRLRVEVTGGAGACKRKVGKGGWEGGRDWGRDIYWFSPTFDRSHGILTPG